MKDKRLVIKFEDKEHPDLLKRNLFGWIWRKATLIYFESNLAREAFNNILISAQPCVRFFSRTFMGKMRRNAYLGT